MFLKIKKTIIFIISFLIALCLDFQALAGGIIRDAETEKFLRELCKPILVAANLDPKNIAIYIVNDESINAFVSGGQNIFINTGLIRKYKTPDALIGVVAHEVGHIAAGHIARSSEEIKKANAAMLLSYILGIGAIAAGAPEAGQGIIFGGMDASQKLYLKFSRGQEEAADKHAVEYLAKIHYPADGLVKLLEFFEEQSRGYDGAINEYAQSHPISRKRIDYLKYNVLNKKYSDKKTNKELQQQMDRVLAKLEGFIDNSENVIKKYKNNENENANYAKSIAFYRLGKVDEALKNIDLAIAKNKNDGFYHELKGQILYEAGFIEDAIISYKKAISNLQNQDSSQAKIYFATAILSLKKNDKDLINLAIDNLKQAKNFEENNPFLFKQLSVAYNKFGDEARSFAALAEYNFLIGDNKKAKKYIKISKEKFEKNEDKNSIKQDLLRLEDLSELIINEEKNQN